MTLKVVLVVLAVIIAVFSLGIGVIAGMGIQINFDFSSSGPIDIPDRPSLETRPELEQTAEETDSQFKFAN